MVAIENHNIGHQELSLFSPWMFARLQCIALAFAIWLGGGCAAHEDTVKIPPSAEQLEAIRAVVLALHDGAIIIPSEAMTASAADRVKTEQRMFLSRFGPTIPIEIYDVGRPNYRAAISVETREYVPPGKAVPNAPAFLFMKRDNDFPGKPKVRGQYSGYGSSAYSVAFEIQSGKAYLDGIVIVD